MCALILTFFDNMVHADPKGNGCQIKYQDTFINTYHANLKSVETVQKNRSQKVRSRKLLHPVIKGKTFIFSALICMVFLATFSTDSKSTLNFTFFEIRIVFFHKKFARSY
jgi:hypothetical protein